MENIYKPPKQKWFGQAFDSIFILVLVYASLMAPLLLDSDDEVINPDNLSVQVSPTWEALNVNAVEQQQWEKLGFDAEKAAELINKRFDYTIEPISLIVTALFIIGYFFFMLKVSKKQYLEVIAEKFGSSSQD
ncbi:hypothetical protein LCGC14_0538950 [marine sediment metagenome]|uniref:Uncharacterized protein n=1 Tax=marine sediment metagenome TaxID=412755 RepID=A0A0F9RTE6_9ZZZZ|nr:hypothetical protein [Methylophaga sp.]HEC59175.1 hypothetical protein [Methylophaga sp.]